MSETDTQNATAIDDLIKNAWFAHAQGDQDGAERHFRMALSQAPESVDAHYGLGLTLKAQGRKEEAIQEFQEVLRLLEGGIFDDRARTEMLQRLAKGQINFLTDGDWNLEKEIWKRIE